MAAVDLDIAGRLVGPGRPCFIIAEAGVNHDGSLDLALKLVEAARAAGADAVKFQSFRAEEVATSDAPKAQYQLAHTAGAESQLEMLRRLELSPAAHRAILARCRELGIMFLSTGFDAQSVDLLEDLGLPAFKVPSGEITNLPLLAHIAGKHKPVILSTGMSSLAEVRRAVEILRQGGAAGIALLHCVSNYPAQPEDVNLKAMNTMARELGLPVGYSDHTLGIEVPLAAVALGACIIEKHFTLDRSRPGPDHAASAEPEELAALARGIRVVEAALGHGRKEPAASEEGTRQVARRSLVAAQHIPAGALITPEMLALKRPGTGLASERLGRVLGRRARAAIAAGTLISLEMLA
ncbi:MAG: N-acetylneuraminate synthase [Pseudomonadota bacterium]